MKIIYEKEKMNCPLKIFDGNGEVFIDDKTLNQAKTYCSMPFVTHASLMPDAHYGKGSTVGSVVATTKVIIPAMVGVDIGCGMMAVKTSLKVEDLPDSLKEIRLKIESLIPHGRSNRGGCNDVGSWRNDIPREVENRWNLELKEDFETITQKHSSIKKSNNINHLGSLGSGNHFIEVCLDLGNSVWIMLHSGSRGVGNRVGTYFISLAKKDMKKYFINLPDKDLAYISQDSTYFWDYFQALLWAQKYAKVNREIMMERAIKALRESVNTSFDIVDKAINCHHNYVTKETHYNKEFWVTRKGAVRAWKGDLGIIPGSMGAKSFVVRGKGNTDSLKSCSHGAGRMMSRNEAKKSFKAEDVEKQTKGVECKKDASVIDEIPKAYKPIEKVMAAQTDLIEVVAELRQVICIKG